MNRLSYLTLVAVLVAGCGVSSGPSAPLASLKVPVCVAAPQEVLFDASGSTDVDGDIQRYVFHIGHRNAPLVVEVPRVSYRLASSYRIKGEYRPMPVSVTVIDSTGLEGTFTAQLWVVDDIQDCAGIGNQTGQDAVEQDSWDQDSLLDTEDDIPEDAAPDSQESDQADTAIQDVPQDWLNPDVAPDGTIDVAIDAAPDMLPPEDVVSDVGPTDTNPLDIPPDTGETCPMLGQTYSVKVRCDGVVQAVLDLAVKQVGCTIKDSYSIVSGSFDGTFLTLESTFTELKIQECSGNVDDVSLFTLECTSGCSAEYELKP